MTPEQELAVMQWNAQNQAIANYQAAQGMRDQSRRNDALNWEYQNKMDQANQANETRYMDILNMLGVNRQNILGDINQWGQSQVDDANTRYKAQEAAGITDAYARGFGGSPSVLNAARNQANKSRDAELARVRDNQISQRVGASERLTNNIAGVMERRNDVAPDFNQLIGLQTGLGRNGPLLGSYPSRGYATNDPRNPGYYGASAGPQLQFGIDPRTGVAPQRSTTPMAGSLYGSASLVPYGTFRPGAGSGNRGVGNMLAASGYVPLNLPAPQAAQSVGYTGLGERPMNSQPIPYQKPMGYAYQTADTTQMPDGRGGYRPMYAPVTQQLPTVPGMVGGPIGAGYPSYGYGNPNTGYNYMPRPYHPAEYRGGPYRQPPRRMPDVKRIQPNRFMSAPTYSGQLDIQYA